MRFIYFIIPAIFSSDPLQSVGDENVALTAVSSTETATRENSTSSIVTERTASLRSEDGQEQPNSPESEVLTEEEQRRRRREMVYQAALARMKRFETPSAGGSSATPTLRLRRPVSTSTFGVAPSRVFSFDDIRPRATLANKGPGHRGLPNLGFTCFINAAVQVLMNAEPVKNLASSINTTIWEEVAASSVGGGWKRSEKLRLAKSFVDLANMYWSGDNTTTVDLSGNTGAFVESLTALDPDTFVRGRMGDSHEVIKAILDAFPSAAGSSRMNPIEALFQIVGEEKRKMCLACERYSGEPIYEPLQELIMKTELVGRAESINLQDYVTSVLANSINETIEGVECSPCSADNGTATVRQTVRLETLTVARGTGSLLVVPLARFQMGSFLKNTISVDIPRVLALSDDQFKLIGVVYHTGSSLNFGHYTASFVDHKDGKWYDANDGIVSEIEAPLLTGETPYLVVYQRKDVE